MNSSFIFILSKQESFFSFTKERQIELNVFYRKEMDSFYYISYISLETRKFQWPSNEAEVKSISLQQYKWLIEGLAIEQKKTIKTFEPENVW